MIFFYSILISLPQGSILEGLEGLLKYDRYGALEKLAKFLALANLRILKNHFYDSI